MAQGKKKSGEARRELNLFVPAPGQNARFKPLLQGQGTNRLAQISTRRNIPDVDPVTGLATIKSGDDFKVFIEKYDQLSGGGFKVSTHKLLDICALALTAQSNYRGSGQPEPRVSFTLEEYMRHCGLSESKASKDKARRKIKADLEILYSTSIEWREPRGGQTRDYAKMRFICFQAIKNGRVMVTFSPEIVSYLTQAYIMIYPLDLLKIDEKNQNAYYLGRKLLYHFSLDGNRRQNTQNIISVKTLLESTPEIPGHQEVAESDRHFERRIVEPLEKSLNILADLGLIRWAYCNAKKQPLNENQLKEFNYQTFKNCYITFDVLNSSLTGLPPAKDEKPA